MKLRGKATLLLASFLAATLPLLAQTPQQPPPKPPEQEKEKKEQKKPRRVWTEDDIKGLRKASDEYAEKKAADQAAAEASKAAAEKEKKEAEAGKKEEKLEEKFINPLTGEPYEDPDSPAGIEKQIKEWEKTLEEAHGSVEEDRREMSSAPNQDKWDTAKAKLDIHEESIREIQELLEGLKVKLVEAKKQYGPAKAPGAAGKPPEGGAKPPEPPKPERP